MSKLVDKFQEWRKERCQHCAAGVPVYNLWGRKNVHVNPEVWFDCTAPTEAAYIVELEEKLKFADNFEIGVAEYAYWRRVDQENDPIDPELSNVCIGAMGAAANIAAALMGHKPTHHESGDATAARKLALQFMAFLAEDEAKCVSSKKTG